MYILINETVLRIQAKQNKKPQSKTYIQNQCFHFFIYYTEKVANMNFWPGIIFLFHNMELYKRRKEISVNA